MPNNVSSEAVGVALAAFLFAAVQLEAGERAPSAAKAMPPVVGATEVVVSDELSGFGLRGFDPVAFFAEGGAKAGEPGLELIWQGVAWRFASAANREAFRHDPSAYAPRLGGHDPNAMAEGHLADGEPTLFSVREGRLYLFRSEESRQRFLAAPARADEAEARWGSLRRDLVQP